MIRYPADDGSILHIPAVKKIAQAHGVSAAQVCLRWIVQQQGHALVTASAERAYDVEDLDLFSFVLSALEMAELTAISIEPPPPPPPAIPCGDFASESNCSAQHGRCYWRYYCANRRCYYSCWSR